MTAISWVLSTDRFVGRNNAVYADVLNRPLRALLTQWGYDPDGTDFSMPTVYAHTFAGANGGLKIQAAITAVAAAGGGVVDCQGLTGAQTLDVNLFANVTSETPLKLIFGASIWTVATTGSQQPWGKLTVALNNTTFVLADGTVAWFLWDFSVHVAGGSAVVTNGSADITISVVPSGVPLDVGRAISIFGHLAEHGGRDNSTLSADITSTQTTIALVSTTGLANGHYIKMENEICRIGTVDSATQISGCIRGDQGTVNASHLSGVATDRVVYQSYEIKAVNGSIVTLDEPFAGISSTGTRSLKVGPRDVSFEGVGTFDGSKPPTNSPNNAGCIGFYNGTNLKVARTITIKSWDHIGVFTRQARHAEVDGTYRDMGWPLEALGFSVIFMHGSKHCTAYGEYENCNYGPATDDRTTSPSIDDNATVGCVLKPRSIRHVHGGVISEGSINCYADVPYVFDWGLGGSGFALSMTGSPQWVTSPTIVGQVGLLGYASPAANAVLISGTPSDGCVVVYRNSAGTVSGTLPNGVHVVGASITVKVAGTTRFSLPISGPITFGDSVAVTGNFTATGTIGVIGGVGATLGGGGQAKLNLDGVAATFAAGEMGIGASVGNMNYYARGSHNLGNATTGITQFSISNAGIINAVTGNYRVAGVDVVKTRKTGYTNLMTGTANRATAYDTSTITLVQLAERVKAIEDDLHATAGHGLIGV